MNAGSDPVAPVADVVPVWVRTLLPSCPVTVRAIYRRLREQGKPDKVTRIAAARKLLLDVNEAGVA
jgi:hypothetical protein